MEKRYFRGVVSSLGVFIENIRQKHKSIAQKI